MLLYYSQTVSAIATATCDLRAVALRCCAAAVRSHKILSTGRLLFGMLVLPRMPLVVLLLLCLLLLSSDALHIFFLEVAFCVFLCGIRFAHLFWLSFRTAIFKKNVFENIWPFPVVISGARAAAADCIWCLRALRSQ